MSTGMARVGHEGASLTRDRLHRRLLIAALVPTVFGALHHAEHVVRGDAGWPLTTHPTPWTFSPLIYPIVLPGLYLSARGRLMPGYWLFVAVLGLLIVAPVHFGPVSDDSLSAVYGRYASPVTGILALVILFGLLGGLAWLAITAIGVRRAIGHSGEGATELPEYSADWFAKTLRCR